MTEDFVIDANNGNFLDPWDLSDDTLDIGGVVRTTYGRDPDGNIFELQEVIAAGLPLDLATLVPGLTPARGPST